MSPTNEYGPQVKKRKKDRACDGCRRRKTKCDGPWMPENVCTNCTHTRKPCTYVEASKPRGPPKAYVTGLEDKLETLEALLQQIRPDVDFSEELGPPVIRGSWKTEIEQSSSSSSVSLTRKPSLLPPILIPFDPQPRDSISSTSLVIPSPRTTHLLFRSQPRSKRTRGADATLPPWLDGSDTEELVITSIRGRNKFTLKASEADDPSNESNIRFHGRSSTAGLVETTRIFKHMHMRETMTSLQQDASSPTAPDNNVVAQTRRPQFWSTPRWETLSQDTSIDCPSHLPTFLRYFPPPDLAGTLIDLYFRHSNLLFPLLHRPTFEKQWRERLQRRNIWFACVCILVFAVASRWCDDERVLPEDARLENGELDWRRAGRHYFALGVEIHRVRKNFFHPASLFEVQTFTLLGMYMRGTDVFPSAWQCISVGVRKAQDVGAHRKKVYHRGKPNADDELWKRAFWHLVVFDRIGGASLGRACGIPEEDFDVDLPLEVDDEYWENGEEPFKQPPGVPSSVTAFNQFIKLTQIMAFTTRTLYAIDKTKVYRGLVPLDQKSLVQQLSSAMNDWLEACPPHLKWHNDIDNPMLSNQSTTIYTTYYLTQMLIHRPLIASAASPPPTPAGNPYPSNFPPPVSPLPNPAIVVCTNAARSCARIVEILLQRGTDFFHVPNIINVAYVCAGSLLLSVWNMKGLEKDLRDRGLPDIKPPLAQVIEEQLADAKIFLRALELVRPRWDVVDLLLKELRQSLPGFDSEGSWLLIFRV
ncbi:fungal-specific transcription factor domain-containing protein [Crassisporium funariophilum]|nr:fungal-specific transcription factor domain-containing protein [Crassisporium funariophilum]